MDKIQALEHLVKLSLGYKKAVIERMVDLPKNSLSGVLGGREMPNNWPGKIVAYLVKREEEIATNNLPENKERILAERSTGIQRDFKPNPQVHYDFDPTLLEKEKETPYQAQIRQEPEYRELTPEETKEMLANTLKKYETGGIVDQVHEYLAGGATLTPEFHKVWCLRSDLEDLEKKHLAVLAENERLTKELTGKKLSLKDIMDPAPATSIIGSDKYLKERQAAKRSKE